MTNTTQKFQITNSPGRHVHSFKVGDVVTFLRADKNGDGWFLNEKTRLEQIVAPEDREPVVDENHAQAVAEGAALRTEIDALRIENTENAALVTEFEGKFNEAVQERGEFAAVLQYALELLSETERERVLGYWDGVKA